MSDSEELWRPDESTGAGTDYTQSFHESLDESLDSFSSKPKSIRQITKETISPRVRFAQTNGDGNKTSMPKPAISAAVASSKTSIDSRARATSSVSSPTDESYGSEEFDEIEEEVSEEIPSQMSEEGSTPASAPTTTRTATVPAPAKPLSVPAPAVVSAPDPAPMTVAEDSYDESYSSFGKSSSSIGRSSRGTLGYSEVASFFLFFIFAFLMKFQSSPSGFPRIPPFKIK